MMDFQTLSDNFTIPGVLTFSRTEKGLIRASVTSSACTAELYLQGAHLTQWQPSGAKPVLFLSDRSLFEPGKAIRGGVPIIFPWFGSRTASPENPRTDGPSHGFARTADWTLAFAAIAGNDLHLTLTLGPSETSRSLGYDHFKLLYQITLGPELRLQLTVINEGTAPFHFEDALHSYFSVCDARKISIVGLSDTDYLDKTENFKRKYQSDPVLMLTGETDRPYFNTEVSVNIDDPVYNRRITIDKSNSKTTVVWNPWAEACAKLPDMSPDGWRSMVCIETANVATDAITLGPGEKHILEAHIFAQNFAPAFCSK
ncbi:MAG: D-hexose-6-phosphate mutarotase [Acidobacteriaceae bacterium]